MTNQRTNKSTNKSNNSTQAEQDLLAGLTAAKRFLGPNIPRLITEKPQVAVNALRHGLSGQTTFLSPTDLVEYLTQGANLILELEPVTPSEIRLAQRIVDAEWRLDRCAAFQAICFQSRLNLQYQELAEANPQMNPNIVNIHAQAFAYEGGINTEEKISRQETRLLRASRMMRADYHLMTSQRTPRFRNKTFSTETSHAYRWYKDLSLLADRLIQAREEIFRKTEEVNTTVDKTGTPVTNPDSTASPETLFCKKSLRVKEPLTYVTLKALDDAFEWDLLTEIEATLLPANRAA